MSNREKKENLANKENLDREVHQGLKDQKEILVPLGSRELLENKDLLELKVNLEAQERMGRKETEDFKETPDLQVNQGSRDLPAKLEALDHQENKATLDHQE